MKTTIPLITTIALLTGFSLQAEPAGSAFTYQGQLQQTGNPVNADCDFQFSLWDAQAAGMLVGATQSIAGLAVSNGVFTTVLDFGAAAFKGDARWLQIAVRSPAGSGEYTLLAPRQALRPTAYAIHAESATTATSVSGAVPASQLTGLIPTWMISGELLPEQVPNLDGAKIASGTVVDARLSTNVAMLDRSQTFSGQNVFLRHIGIGNPTPFWSIDALDEQTVGKFVSTNTPNGSVIELQNLSPHPWKYLGAINFNNPDYTTPGQLAYIAQDSTNQNLDVMAFRVGGSVALQLLGDPRGMGAGSLVGGFPGNSVSANGAGGNVIAGGGFIDRPNTILSNSAGVFIGAGSGNQVGPNVADSVIAGGVGGTIQSTASFIGSGINNQILTNSHYSVIAGGFQNSVQSLSSFIGGGQANSISTNADLSSILGGSYNSVTAPYSLASGIGAQANHAGATVFADGRFEYFPSSRSNEFSIRAANGVRIQSEVGIHLTAGDQPMIVRDWDVFATNAPSSKAGIGRWGLFMENSSLVAGIPGDDLSGRFFRVGKYSTDGSYTPLMTVDQAGNVTANGFYGSGANLTALSASQLSGALPSGSLSGIYSGAVTFNNAANNFTGNGGGLTNVNAASLGGVSASGYAKLNSSPTFTGTVSATSLVVSNSRVSGLLRLGSEAGTSESPLPAGLVVRRINSTTMSSNQVVAVARTQGNVANISLVRDGSNGGFQINYPAAPGNVTIACMGMDINGAQKNVYRTLANPATAGFVKLYTAADNIVHFQCSFGITFEAGQHLTQVTLSRFNSDNYWSGTLTSTVNQ